MGAGAPERRSRGRPKTAPDAAHRTEIVAEALRIFRELGYAKLTTDAVAARCQISKTTLYRLFPSKTDLIAAIMGGVQRGALHQRRAAPQTVLVVCPPSQPLPSSQALWLA